MKRSLLFAVAVLLIATLFVSCNANKVEEDQLGNVSISGLSRTLDVTGEADVDVENLYWYYSATKADLSIFVTGKTEWKAVKNGKGLSGTSLGSFSSGAWTFCFYGFASEQSSKPSSPTEAAVYYQLGVEVAVEKNKQTNVVLELTPGALPDPVFAVNAVTWQYEEAPGIVLTLKIYADTATTTATTPVMTLVATTNDAGLATFSTSTGEYAPFTLGSNEYSLRFEVVYTNGTFVQIVGETTPVSVIAEKGMSYTIVNHGTGIGIETTEEQGTVYIDGIKAVAKKDIPPTATGAAEFVADITPATATEPTSAVKTTVSFPDGALDGTVSYYSMSTEVYPIETTAASTAFVVESADQTSAAAIDLTLLKDDLPVTTFNSKAVVVTSYVAKGLTKVNVVYNTDGGDIDTTGIDAGGTEAGKAYVAAILTDAEQALGYLGYNPNTGYLSFTTTHFSLFAVGADENVYDKTTNTAYKLSNIADYFDDTHEYVLLDSKVANDVPDVYDVFNSGMNWTVLHTANDKPNTTDFAGGYGTKIEPYLISSRENLQNIKSTAKFTYYKVSSCSQFDCSDWTSLEMHGSFDGNNASFTNLDSEFFNYVYGTQQETCVVKNCIINCDIFSTGATASLIGSTPFNLVVENVDVSGSICGYSVGGYLCYGAAQWTGDYTTTVMKVTFKDCLNTATLVSYGEGIGGFIEHPFCDFVANGTGDSLITIIDSAYVGTMKSTSDNMDYFAYQGNHVLVKETYSEKFIGSLITGGFITDTISGELHRVCTPNAEGIIDCGNYSTVNDLYRPENSSYRIKMTAGSSGSLPANYGDAFAVQKVSGAVSAYVAFMIAPNDAAQETGSYLATYMDESIDLTGVEGSFNTSSIKYWKVDINADGVTAQGLDSSTNTYHVYDGGEFYGHTHNGASVYVIQYDSGREIVGITIFNVAAANSVGVMYNNSSLKAAAVGFDYTYDTGLELSEYDVEVVFVDRDNTWYYNFDCYAPFNGTNVMYPSIPSSKYVTDSTFVVDGSKIIIKNIEKKSDRYDYGSLRYGIRVTKKTN